jgi:glycosyltransferase involved in cell wall biosynthesis
MVETKYFQLTRKSQAVKKKLCTFSSPLVLAHFAQDALRIAPVATKVGKRVISICHGSDVLSREVLKGDSFGLRYLKRNWVEYERTIDLSIAISGTIAAELQLKGIPSRKIEKFYIGTSIPETIIPIENRIYDITYLGRLTYQKGFDRFINIVLRLSERFPHLSVCIAGDGPQRELIGRIINTSGINVDFKGIVSVKMSKQIAALSKVLIVPTRPMEVGGGEGLSMAAVESLSTGTPIVSSNVGGLGELSLLKNLAGNALVESDIEKQTELLLREVEYWRELSLNGSELARKIFDVSVNSKVLENFLWQYAFHS